MKAVVHDKYGSPNVLRVDDVARPVPKEDEVLVRVHATTVTRTDCHIRAAKPMAWRFYAGLLRPRRRILGIEFAGVVEAVGAAVTEFQVGDEVFGGSAGKFAAHAEYVAVRAGGAIALKPAGISFEEAAAVTDGFAQAVAALGKGEVKDGTRLVVYGATGSLGTASVQLAKHYGANVTAVGNTKNVGLMRSLGADEVVDYLQEDFTKNGRRYDVILDAVGKYSYLRCRGSIEKGGLYVATDLGKFHLANLTFILWTKWFGDSAVVFPSTRYSKQNVLLLKELIESGKYRAVIDRSYPLEDVVEATRYVETGQKTGNVVLTLL